MRAVTESSLFQPLRPQINPEVAALREEVLGLRRLQEAIHFLGGAPDPIALRSEILELACSLSGLPRGSLALPTSAEGKSKKKKRYKVKESRGTESLKGTQEHRVLRGILNRALERREALLEGAIREGGILDHAESHARQLDLGAVACLPLEVNGEIHGALILDDPERNEPFTAAEESLLRSFARHAALALERVRVHGHAKRRLARLTQRNERLEAERERLEDQARQSQRRAGLTKTSERVRKEERAGREYRRLLEEDYAAAKEAFTVRYLRELLRRTEGDLNAACEESGLPMARLVGLLDRLQVQPPKKRRSHRSSSGGHKGSWGASVSGGL
jgi:GAF domain-containing protein